MERRKLLWAMLAACAAPAGALVPTTGTKGYGRAVPVVAARPYLPFEWSEADQCFRDSRGYILHSSLDFVAGTRTDYRTNPPTVTTLSR